MTEEQAKRIADLTADVYSKGMRYQALAMRNTWGLSADEAKALSVEYHIAHAEYLEAQDLLESAKRPVVSSQSV